MQAKEYLPAHALRKIVLLQTELVKDTMKNSYGSVDYPYTSGFASQKTPAGTVAQRTLLSANFTNLANPLIDGTRAAGSLGRNILSAGDKLRDLIVPDALATVVSAPVGWIPGIGGSRKVGSEKNGRVKVEKLRDELDDVLASSCPLCESVVAGLDKPFVKEGELDTTWAL
jgi:vacuolar protein sorting-associated protein 18